MTDSVGGGGTKPGEGSPALAGGFEWHGEHKIANKVLDAKVLDADIAAELARSPRIEGYVFGAVLLIVVGLGVYAVLSMTLSGG